MQKRSEANKEVKMQFRTKLKKTAVIVLCVLFAYSAIYAADIANKKMLNKENEDRYALRLSETEEDMLRVDLAGTKHYIDISSLKAFVSRLADKTQELFTKFAKESENFTDRIYNHPLPRDR